MSRRNAIQPEVARPASDATRKGPNGAVIDAFLEAKLHAPPARDVWVSRVRLLEQLEEAVSRRLTLVAAPAGYGKTTLAAQWIASDRAPAAAWVSLDQGDNDPVRLWTHIVNSLERAGCAIDLDLFTVMAAASDEVLLGLLSHLVNALAAMPDDIVLVLDDFHLITQPGCHEQLSFLVEHLPSHAHVVLLTRADPSLRLGRLRVAGDLAEIRADDLSFSTDEAALLMGQEDVQLTAASVDDLVLRTEGWPAGLYMAALSLVGRSDPDAVVHEFTGDNRFIGDYLTEEVLSRHTLEERSFIATMSLFDRFSSALADHVTESAGAGAILNNFERTNLFLVSLDYDRRWFRFHHLFAAVARNEFEDAEPEHVRRLHARAAGWFRANGYVDEAVKHFLVAGEEADAAHLIQANWFRYVDVGRAATVVGWLQSLGQAAILSDPAAMVTAAWLAALSGDRQQFTQLLAMMEQFRDVGPLPDGTRSVESAVSLLKGVFGFGGPDEMLAAGRRAVELEVDGSSPFYGTAYAALAHAEYVTGDLDAAVSHAVVGAHSEAAPSVIQMLASSVVSYAEAERGNAAASTAYAERAMALVDNSRLAVLPQSSFAFTAWGDAQARAGKSADAMVTLEHNLVLRRKNAALTPWPTIHLLRVMADVAIDLGQFETARSRLDEAEQLLSDFEGDLAAMHARLASVRARLAAAQQPLDGGEHLTERELEIVALLDGPLSLSKIADELFLSPNTVKTHTRAIYRKLGASSRDEAVRIAHARELV